MHVGALGVDAVAEVYLGDGLYNTVRVVRQIASDLDISGSQGSKQVGNEEHEHEPEGDVADLRAELKLARERLATYQRFDRDIAENVHRSSELMLEAMQVRDRMEGEATEQARARRARLANRLQSIEDDLGAVQAQVATLLVRMGELRQEIDTGSGQETAGETTPDGGEVPSAASWVVLKLDAEPVDERSTVEPDGPVSVELIASGMTRAASALALQSHLRNLEQVRSVDAREFSSGVLRLQLEVLGEIADADLLGWAGDEDVTVYRHPENAIELRIGE